MRRTASQPKGITLTPDLSSLDASQGRSMLAGSLASDPRLRAMLEAAARAGHLRQLATLPEGDDEWQLFGHYDSNAGVLVLPARAFETEMMLTGTLRVQSAVIRFAHSKYALDMPITDHDAAQHPVTRQMTDNLQRALNSSPALARLIVAAATTPDTPGSHVMLLEGFGITRPGNASGGSYRSNTHTIHLTPSSLSGATTVERASGFDLMDMVFVLGHEAQHALNHPDTARAVTRFLAAVRQVSKADSIPHDYTNAVADYLQAKRIDEASAEISGWNSLVSHLRLRNPDTALPFTTLGKKSNNRVADFLDYDSATRTATPKPGLTFNPDNSLSMTPANIAAMGVHYFGRPAPASGMPRPVSIGESGEVDYTNYYGTWAIEQIIEAERRHSRRHPRTVHELTLDMARLGLSERLLEKEGVDITIDKDVPQRYYDSSQTPPRQSFFHHTQDGSVNPAHDHDHVPINPIVMPQAPRLDLEMPLRPQSIQETPFVPALRARLGSVDRQMFDVIRDKTPGHLGDDVVLDALVAIRNNGIDTPGHIGSVHLAGDQLMVVGTIPGFRASVDICQSTSHWQQSLDQLDVINASAAQELEQTLPQQHAQLRLH